MGVASTVEIGGLGGRGGGRDSSPATGARELRVASPLSVFQVLWRHRWLAGRLAWRDVLQRYRGSTFGLLWSLFHPLVMLGIFTFVFSQVFRARWGVELDSTAEFGSVMFAGLVVFWMFSECLGRAPALMLENPAYIKRVVFPLEVLPWVVVLSGLFHTAVNSLVLVGAVWWISGSFPWTALTLPAILLPVALIALGATWFVSSLGVYVRDLQMVVPVFLTALLFLTPIFYPPTSIPPELQKWFALNPLATAVEEARGALVFGRLPDPTGLAVAFVGSWAVGWLGLVWFARTRRGFADVL